MDLLSTFNNYFLAPGVTALSAVPFSACFTCGKLGCFDVLGMVPSNGMKRLLACFSEQAQDQGCPNSAWPLGSRPQAVPSMGHLGFPHTAQVAQAMAGLASKPTSSQLCSAHISQHPASWGRGRGRKKRLKEGWGA